MVFDLGAVRAHPWLTARDAARGRWRGFAGGQHAAPGPVPTGLPLEWRAFRSRGQTKGASGRAVLLSRVRLRRDGGAPSPVVGAVVSGSRLRVGQSAVPAEAKPLTPARRDTTSESHDRERRIQADPTRSTHCRWRRKPLRLSWVPIAERVDSE